MRAPKRPADRRAMSKCKRRGRGIEAAAREVRYAAFAEAAREAGARIVLTAHHRDDRLETFLFQWMRGAGLDGLAAFPAARAFDDDLQLLRPLIDVRARRDRALCRSCARLDYVDDDSNDDAALLRNAVRRDVLPRLDALRPGFRTAAARSVDLVAEGRRSDCATWPRPISRRAPKARRKACCGSIALAALPAAARPGCCAPGSRATGIEAPSRARLLEVLRSGACMRAATRGCWCGSATMKCGATADCCC